MIFITEMNMYNFELELNFNFLNYQIKCLILFALNYKIDYYFIVLFALKYQSFRINDSSIKY